MYNLQSNPYQKYKQQSVMTMTQTEMITMLYDEVVKQLNAAMLMMDKKDLGVVNSSLQKSQRIINYLRNSLNHNYEVSGGLEAMYEYFNYQIVQANIKKSKDPLVEIIPMVKELKETFVTANQAIKAH